MEDIKTALTKALPDLSQELISLIAKESSVMEIPKGTKILREGQFVKVVPIVLSGLIKVFTGHEGKDFLLYYIQPNESCVMTFTASLKNEPSKIYALTEEDTKALLIPTDKVTKWISEFPDFSTWFFELYNQRYSELLETVHDVLFEKMDKRLYDYLKEKGDLTNKNPLNISHRQIANELGTAREVISRVMKKLESEGKVKQLSKGIKLLK